MNPSIKLGYSQLWLDSGILTIEKLAEQIEEFELGEDQYSEHYRYRCFLSYFKSQPSFDDKTLEILLQLLKTDNDKTMAGSATLELLRNPCLTEGQFEKVASLVQSFGDWTITRIAKARQSRATLGSNKSV